MKPTFASEFVQWVVERIRATGLVPAENVFDSRERDLGWLISEGLASGLGLAVVVSYPRLKRASRNAAAAEHTASVLVAIHCNNALAQGVNSYEVAEGLYYALDASFFPPSREEFQSPNVVSDSLTDSPRKGNVLHSFIVSATL